MSDSKRIEAAEEALDAAGKAVIDEGEPNGPAIGRYIALIGILLAAGFTILEIEAMSQM